VGHWEESDDILTALKSVGESPMNPLGMNWSLTLKGSATGPLDVAPLPLPLPPPLPPPLPLPFPKFVEGGVEPGAEHAA
jgi:hypothetical protein